MARVTDLGMNLETGTENVQASWGFDQSLESQTEGFRVQWWYTIWNANTGAAGEYSDGDTTVDISDKTPWLGNWRAVYSPGNENWGRVTVQVTPIPLTYDLNGTQTQYYTGEPVMAHIYKENTEPSTPDAPTVSYAGMLDGKTRFHAVVSIDDERTTSVEFQVWSLTIGGYPSGVIATYTLSVVNGMSGLNFSIDAGRGCTVRCRAINTRAGEYGISEWSEYSSNVFAKPSAPTNLTARASSDTAVYLSWKISSAYQSFADVGAITNFEIEYTDDLQNFNESATGGTIVQTEGTDLYYVVSGLEEGSEYYFRVRAVNDIGSSDWSNIAQAILGSPPNAPTTWSSSTTVIVGQTLILYWVHNSEDGSDARKSKLELIVGGDTKTYEITNPDVDDDDPKTLSYTINTSQYPEGTEIRWRVCTAGISGEYGDWSVRRTVIIYAQPTVTIDIRNSEDESVDVIESFPVIVYGTTAPDTQQPIGYTVTVYSQSTYDTYDNVGEPMHISVGQIIFSQYVADNDELELELSAGDVNFVNGMTYLIEIVASMDSGLSATNSLEMSVSWVVPDYRLDAQMGLDKTSYTMNIVPYCRDSDTNELVQDILLSVYRKEYDGTYTEIVRELRNEDFAGIIDPHPSLSYASYRLAATDIATGATTFYDTPGYPVNGDSVIIQWDETWSSFDARVTGILADPPYAGSLVKIPYNIDVQESSVSDVTLVNYIGRRDPVSYYGTAIDTQATWNVDVPKTDLEMLYQLRRLSKWTGDAYVREPSGVGYWANVAVSFNRNHQEVVMPVTFTITRVSGGA